MSHKKVRKAVIAAAGFGTRFLPQTKAMPKEMLPLIDKPIIQYIVEELVGAGIEDIVIVTGYHKRSIEDHFDEVSADLKQNLEYGNKLGLLEEVENIAGLANFAYVRQKGVYGNATPLLNVEHLIGDEPFIYTYADDLVVASPSRFRQIIEAYNTYEAPILPCIRVNRDEDFSRYGIVAGEHETDSVLRMTTIVEKPGRDAAPSDFASVGGYLLTPDIFSYLKDSQKHLKPGEEFQVQPAMREMIKQGKPLYACEIQDATYYDTGNKLEYLKTVVDFALQREDISQDFRNYLTSLSVDE